MPKARRKAATRTVGAPRLQVPAALGSPPKGRRKPATATSRGYYRFPTIHDDRIAFCGDDDLWVVGTQGGVARRLTVAKALSLRPVFSPDGTYIAFTSFDDGASEVFVIPSEGGEHQRLTFMGSNVLTLGWSPDGQEVLFASDAGQPFLMHHHLHAVSLKGGPPRAFNLGPARSIAHEPGGRGVVIGRNGLDPARWKRYRGGTAGTLWVDRQGKGRFRQILNTVRGNLASPMWIGKRIYFVSDHEGIGNIYSCRPDGRDLQRHTDQDEYYARFPGSDNRRIVYHAGADLFVFDTQTGQDRGVPVEIRTPRSQRQRKFITGSRNLESYSPHPKGHSAVLTVRGRPVTMGLWEGPVTEWGTPWRGRHRLATWLADGKRMVAVTDASGEERLEILTPGEGAREIDIGQDLGRILTLSVAPHPPQEAPKRKRGRGKTKKKTARKPPPPPDRIAVTNQRQEIFIVDLTRKKARLLERSDYDRVHGISWSPDGRWLAYGLPVGRRNIAIQIADAETGKTHPVTSGDFMDFCPCFDPEGKYLYFLSLRTYDPVYDLIQCSLGFPRGVRPYLMTLRADATSPFLPAPRPLGAKKPDHERGNNPWEVEASAGVAAGGAPAKAEKTPTKVAIDFEGIEGRVLGFPVAEGRYDDLQAIPGKIFLRSHPIEGSLGQHWSDTEPGTKSTIEVYDLVELKSGTLVTGASSFQIARDGKTLLYRAGRRLRAVMATAEPGKLPPGDEVGRRSGWIDLDRVRCAIRPAEEWRQMLAEAWRLQRDQFWVPDLSKIDWVRVYNRYLPLVDRVSSRAELSDLIWEMQAELGTSHCYEFGGDYRAWPQYATGLLGADLALDERQGTWKVVSIPEGDSWDAKQASPLASPGLNIRPGAVIHAVGGRAVGADLSPMECLVHQAGQEVWLTVSDPPGRGKRRAGKTATRTVSLRTLRSEQPLRYRAWAEGNRKWVHGQSRGRVGYVHIPNMGPAGYSEFHRYFLAEIDREGLIIDVRHNGGGHVSQLLLEKLLRKRIGYDINRYMAPEPYPSESPSGPMVALTDELAGSDGDIFSHSWKLYGLGPLIGKRTWGGVIGIWPRHPLVDGTITTQPEFSFWFKDVGWGVENYGTDPDIEVDVLPQDYAAGRDPQLQRGLREIMQQIREFKLAKPNLRERPSRALPRLPRRRKR